MSDSRAFICVTGKQGRKIDGRNMPMNRFPNFPPSMFLPSLHCHPPTSINFTKIFNAEEAKVSAEGREGEFLCGLCENLCALCV